MDNILNINLETSTAPKIVETKYKDWIEYGTDDYRNLFPNFLIDLYYNSSTHSAIINATADMVAGQSLLVEESDNLDAYVRLKKFIATANSKEDLHTVFKKCAFDLKLHGSFALNVIWSKDKLTISELWHVPMERIRMGVPNEMGRVDTYYISADWSNTRRNKPLPVPAFNLNDRTSASQLLVDGLYSPAMQIYNTPDYVSGCNWALIDQKVAEFHLNNISNGFSGSFFISFANGVPSQEERMEIERSIAKKFTGEKAAGRFILTFSDDKTRTPEITPIDQSKASETYLALQELLVQNILTAHRVTSPMLMGIRSDSGLGNNAQEMIEAYEIYSNSVVRPFQEVLLKCFKKVLEVNEINLPISIQQFKPVSTRWNIDTLKEIMSQDEIREEIGLEPLQDTEETLKEEDEDKKYEMSEEDSLKLEQEIINYINSLTTENEYDIEDEYQLLDEEKIESAEKEELHHEEFISASGKAGTSSKDDKSYRKLYKIRYVYRGGGIKETSRKFCETMISSHYGSLFTYEDIKGLSNDEFGSYDVFKYKGSYNCRHYWLRRVYVLKKAPRAMIVNGRIYKRGDYLPKNELKNYYPRNKGYIPADAGVPNLTPEESAANRVNTKVS